MCLWFVKVTGGTSRTSDLGWRHRSSTIRASSSPPASRDLAFPSSRAYVLTPCLPLIHVQFQTTYSRMHDRGTPLLQGPKWGRNGKGKKFFCFSYYQNKKLSFCAYYVSCIGLKDNFTTEWNGQPLAVFNTVRTIEPQVYWPKKRKVRK